jgi:hypothetical protein
MRMPKALLPKWRYWPAVSLAALILVAFLAFRISAQPVTQPSCITHSGDVCGTSTPNKPKASDGFLAFVSTNHDEIEAIAAVIAAIAALVLVLVTGGLWGATGRLATSTDDLAAGASDQVEEMRRTREVQETQLSIGRAQMRAFVFLENFEVGFSTAHHQQGVAIFPSLTITPKWKNSGATPTRNLELRVTARQWEGPLPENHDYFYQDDPVRGVIGPDANEWSAPQFFTRFPAQEAATEDQHAVYIWGEARYSDVFENTPRYTRFCYRTRVHEIDGRYYVQLVAYGPYNRTDHDG